MASGRVLDTITLNTAARDYVGIWFQPTIWSRKDRKRAIGGRDWVLQSFFNAAYMDEFDYLLPRFRAQLGPDALKDFNAASGDLFTQRDSAVLEAELEMRLAINPAGEHIKGKIGKVQVGEKLVGMHTVEVETPESIRYRRRFGLSKADHRETYLKFVPKRRKIFAGEVEEHGHKHLVDFIRDQSGALNTNVSIAFAQAALDAALDLLDEGSLDALIEGHSDSAAQPVDPDAAAAGVVLFEQDMSAEAFGAAADDSPDALATAATIDDDADAGATGTLSHVRVSSSSSSKVPLNSHLEGEAGTSAADFNFNTLAIVTNAVVSMTSYTVTFPQGPTAT